MRNMIRFIRNLPPGRAWAYLGVLMGFSLSITANVAETVLTETSIPLALRLPFAIAWPGLTYVAIEVLTRTMWARFAWKRGQSWAHLITRLVLWVPVGGVAAYSSYLHQSHLFALGGEPGPIVTYGPLAVDGMLFGCTATLIITKVVRERMDVAPINFSDLDEEFMRLESVLPQPAEDARPISPAPVRTRKPRGRWDAAKVVEMAVDGATPQEAHEATGIGVSTFYKYLRVAKILKGNPQALVRFDEIKVPAEHTEMMRRLISR